MSATKSAGRFSLTTIFMMDGDKCAVCGDTYDIERQGDKATYGPRGFGHWRCIYSGRPIEDAPTT